MRLSQVQVELAAYAIAVEDCPHGCTSLVFVDKNQKAVTVHVSSELEEELLERLSRREATVHPLPRGPVRIVPPLPPEEGRDGR